MLRTTMLASAALLALSASALAQNDEKAAPEIKPLNIGDDARPIDISNWLIGDKVAKFEPGKVYVLEFWATWCGPCKKSMPHLSELQHQYKDYGVTFIGISDEDVNTVKKFLDSNEKESGKKWSDVIGYTLTTDPDKSVKDDYWTASGQNMMGIPSAFIIGKDSKIEWIGNPHPEAEDGFDKALEAVVKDSWDRNAFKAEFEKKQAETREATKFQREFGTAMRAKQWDKVMSMLDERIAKEPNAAGLKFQKFAILLAPMNQPEKAYAYGNDLLTQQTDDAMFLNQLAWFVVENKEVQKRDYDFALKAAQRANELTKGEDGGVLDTLATVYAGQGDYANAVKYEKMAVEHAPAEIADELKANLAKFEAKLNGK